MNKDYFYFKSFKIRNVNAALKVNSDGVLLGAWSNVESDKRILDVGTGTGVISFIVRSQNNQSQIVGIDIDKMSISESIHNRTVNRFECIDFYHCSLQNFEPKAKFDHVISNLPYFQNDTVSSKGRLNIAKHSSSLNFQEFWSCMEKCTHEHSKISVILPHEESLMFESMGLEHQFSLSRVLNTKSRSRSHVSRRLMEFRKSNVPINAVENTEIIIHEEGRNNYTEAYMNLVKDYYLKM